MSCLLCFKYQIQQHPPQKKKQKTPKQKQTKTGKIKKTISKTFQCCQKVLFESAKK